MEKIKILVAGMGNVGASLVYLLALSGKYEIYAYDINHDMALGKSLDIQQSCAVLGIDAKIHLIQSYTELERVDISVITAGFPRKPGMRREELINANAEIVKEVVENIRKSGTSMYIVVTNPVDAMAYLTYRVSGLDRTKVLGMGGVLDTARLKYFISRKLNVSYGDIYTMVLGGHGEEMVPVISSTKVSGKDITTLLSKQEINTLIEKTQNGGAEIVSLLKVGSAYYAPSMSAFEMIESITLDKNKTLPCSVMCQGEYGINGMFFGVPVSLGINGVEKIVEISLSNEEKEMLEKSKAKVKETHKLVDQLLSSL